MMELSEESAYEDKNQKIQPRIDGSTGEEEVVFSNAVPFVAWQDLVPGVVDWVARCAR